MNPIDKTARVAGALYLLITVIGYFSISIPRTLIVPGNATATAGNILGHETLFRLGIAAGLISSVIFIVLVMALHHLLRDVARRLASLMVVLVMVAVAAGFVDVLSNVTAITLFRGADFLTAFDTPQRDALGMLFLGLQSFEVSESFWGLWLLPFGALVMRSGFLPRILGVWLVLNGLAYLTVGFTALLSPQYVAMVSRITFPLLFGEVAIALWLLIKGAKVRPLAAAAV